MNAARAALRHHVTGAIERGEAVAITEQREPLTFYLQHGKAGEPMRTEAVQAREDWRPQPRRGSVTACRFLVRHNGRWHRLYSDHATTRRSLPHFIRTKTGRIAVTGVCP